MTDRVLNNWKPSKADRLRADKAADEKAARTLSALYRAVYKRDGYRCVACGCHVVVGGVNERTRAHPHHIIFRSHASKAIKHTSGNICCLCPICHSDIGTKLFISGNADKALTIRKKAA